MVRLFWVNSSAGASYNLDYSRKGPTALAVGASGRWFGHFYSRLSFSFLSLPLFGRRPDID